MVHVEPGALSYTLDQAAHVTGMSRDLLYRAVKSGDLPAKRTSKNDSGEPTGRIIVIRRDLEHFLENLPDDWWGSKYM